MKRFKIGLAAVGSRDWLGGVSYIEFIFRALRTLPREAQPELSLVVDNPDALTLYENTLPLADNLFLVGPQFKALADRLPPQCRQYDAHRQVFDEVDMFFPGVQKVAPHPNLVSWIWDFQHVHLPHLFSDAERASRDDLFSHFARTSHTLVFSSHDAERDFHRLFPGSQAHIHILHFHLLPSPSFYEGDAIAVAHKYQLPERYFICCNQFWMHKNHIRILEAVKILEEQGQGINAVFTGPTSDGRMQDWFPGLMELIKDWNIQHRIHILGTIPRTDQVQLIRRAMFLVQPSLFEGWSTVVEDGRALGKLMLLSDIGVHREQNPDGALFFDPHRSKELAALIHRRSLELAPGPDRDRESRALHEARVLVEQYANNFSAIAREVHSRHDVSLG